MSKPEMMEYIRRKVRPCVKSRGRRGEFVRGENSIAIDLPPWPVVRARRVRWARMVMSRVSEFGPKAVAKAVKFLAEAKLA